MIITADKNDIVRFVRSGFGIRRLWRRIRNSQGRKQVISKILSGESLELRREAFLLLGSPVLLADPEVPALQRYAAQAQNTLVEIGCAYGGSSLLFLLGKKDKAKVYSIDPFVVDSMDKFQATRDLCFNHVNRALSDVGKADRSSSWNLIPDYSYNVVKDWDQPIDVLFIDGDHRYEAVKQDFEEWLPFVKKNGIIFFHDSCRMPGTPDGKYNQGWQGPTRLVNELRQDSRVRLIEQIHSISAFKKYE